MNPFESAAEFVDSLAANLYAYYAMVRFIPVIEDLEHQAAAAAKRQDFAMIAQLAITEAVIQQQINMLSYDA